MHKYPKHLRVRYDHVSVAYGKRYMEDHRPLFKQKELVVEADLKLRKLLRIKNRGKVKT